MMTIMKSRKPTVVTAAKRNKGIPKIPFTLEEVYSLTERQASEELQNRLRVWKASKEYAFIKSLHDIIIKDYSGHNRKLSKQEGELRNRYINWLAVGLESDKFKALDNIRLKNANLIRREIKEDNDDEESYHKDMLTHRGIL